jgi:hypothetical protein
MKTLFLSLLCLGALAAAALAQAGSPVKITGIAAKIVTSPEYTIIGGPQHRAKLGNWLEIEVAFATTVEDLDELTFAYNVMIGKTLLDGSVTHVAIPKGPEHYSVMYIPPRALEKLVPGKPFGLADVGNVWVSISHQGQILDAPQVNQKAALKPLAMPNLPHQTGILLNKNDTPFAPLFYDRYEAIKPAR